MISPKFIGIFWEKWQLLTIAWSEITQDESRFAQKYDDDETLVGIVKTREATRNT